MTALEIVLGLWLAASLVCAYAAGGYAVRAILDEHGEQGTWTALAFVLAVWLAALVFWWIVGPAMLLARFLKPATPTGGA